MLNELDILSPRVRAWPDAAKEQLVRAIHAIEAQRELTCSRPGGGQLPPLGQVGNIADAETEAFFKRHSFWF